MTLVHDCYAHGYYGCAYYGTHYGTYYCRPSPPCPPSASSAGGSASTTSSSPRSSCPRSPFAWSASSRSNPRPEPKPKPSPEPIPNPRPNPGSNIETLALPKRNPSLALNVARSCSWRCCSTATSFVRLVAPRGGSSRSRPRRKSGRRCAAPALAYSAPAPTQAPTVGPTPAGYQLRRKPRCIGGTAITERTRCLPCSTDRRCAHAQYVHVVCTPTNLPTFYSHISTTFATLATIRAGICWSMLTKVWTLNI